jgi:hypothetical protein
MIVTKNSEATFQVFVYLLFVWIKNNANEIHWMETFF